MPPLLCPSPVLLDHSFPRDEDQLNLVAIAMGELIACVENNEAHLLLTETLRDFIGSFDWDPPQPIPLLLEIHRLLSQLYLQPNERLILLDVSNVSGHEKHPVPQGCEEKGLVEFWAEELGKARHLHDQCCGDETFFIGVACERAFGGEDIGSYNNPDGLRAFPLVSPATVAELDDAYDWHPTKMSLNDVRQRDVSFDAAKKNIGSIGAVRVDAPRGGGSHYIVVFNGARSWTLDKNDDPLPETYLRQLVPITGYSLNVIKYALLFGELPDKQLKVLSVAHCTFGA